MMQKEMTKSLPVSKQLVYDSYLKVCDKNGGAGIDKETIELFNENLSNNLYKIWNRMASGSYFPPAVRTVFIPKKQGGVRPLGIPTVSDRIAQGVVKDYLEPIVEKVFHNSSFGYRPGRSAHDALAQCMNNCIKKAWVVDVDIQGFFDNIDHEKMLELLQVHSQENWITLYVNRWLKAGVEQEDGSVKAREKGTPQGGVASPLLANIYLHHAHDQWLSSRYPQCPFERYADDIVIHCESKEEAEEVLEALRRRMKEYALDLHPEKTRIVYCKNYRRGGHYLHESFVFLSFSFHSGIMDDKFGRKKVFQVFYASICNKARTSIRESIRTVFKSLGNQATIEILANKLNPKVRGWINYYSKFSREKALKVFYYLNVTLRRWIKAKYRIKGEKRTYQKYLLLQQAAPDLFYHWRLGIKY